MRLHYDLLETSADCVSAQSSPPERATFSSGCCGWKGLSQAARCTSRCQGAIKITTAQPSVVFVYRLPSVTPVAHIAALNSALQYE